VAVVSSHTRFNPGNGSKIRFWDDVWCGLKEVFPGLYSIASVKDASIVDNMDFMGGTLQWNVSFFQLVHD
jgi:hypothetical protein